MAYIGNAKTPLIFASNTRDDIIPVQKEDGSFEDKFTLSQEVPGGYENNVMVIRRRFIFESSTPASSAVTITKTLNVENEYVCQLTTSDATLALILNDIIPPTANYEGDHLKLNTTANVNNDGKTVPVLDKTFDGTTLTLTLDISEIDLEPQTGGTTSLNRAYYGAWEILDAEKDYSIVSGDGIENINKVISFDVALQQYDIAYVLHRGDATYNFVPSANSVGPDQLAHNLRNFVCDRHIAEANQTDFDLSQDVVSSKAILVFVDDAFTDGDDLDNNYLDGSWTLGQDFKTITFKTPLQEGTRVRVLHLGFSTVMRRYGFFPGQQSASLLDRTVTTNKLAIGAVTNNRLANSAVTLEKISDDAVDGNKLLLSNTQAIRIKNTAGTSARILELNGNNTRLRTAGTELVLDVSDNTDASGLLCSTDGSATWYTNKTSAKLSITTTSNSKGLDITTNASLVELNSKDLPLKIGNQSGSIQLSQSGSVGLGTNTPVEKLDVVGSIKASQNVIAQNVQTQTINGLPVDQVGCPTGTIVMSAVLTAPSGWELCRGQVVDGTDTKYQNLYAAIGNTFGGTGTQFAIPDLQHRVAVGSSTTLQRGATDNIVDHAQRTLSHKHSGGSHTHSISHTHELPAHNHTVSAASSLSMPNDCGGHKTDIAHDHTNISTNSDEGHHAHPLDKKSPAPTSPQVNSTATTVLINFAHNHRSWPESNWNGTTNNGFNPFSLTYSAGNADHMPIRYISIPAGGGHEHLLNSQRACDVSGANLVSASSPNTTNAAAYEFALGVGGGNVDKYSGFIDKTPPGSYTAHSHPASEFSTGISPWFTDNALSNSKYDLLGSTGSDSSTTHKHNISAIRLVSSTATLIDGGLHKHPTTDFSGAIGVSSLTKTLTSSIITTSKTILVQNTTNILVGHFVVNSVFSGGKAKIVSVSSSSIVVDSFATTAFGAAGTGIVISAASGDEILTTQSQSASTSGDASPHETGTATIPHIVLNFIIKL